VSAGSERGLLGLAFHPQYEQNGRFFVYYSAAPDGKLTIEEYKRSANPDEAGLTVVDTLASIVHVNSGGKEQVNHNGGMIGFGKDGYLYAGTGDGGDGGDLDNNAQNKSLLLGKMLRFDVSGAKAKPAGNYPGADPHIWDIGMRNPWRWSFDRATGEMYIGEVGQGAWEEVDIEAPGTGHINYGWHIMEGTHCFDGACDKTGLKLPIIDYAHSGDDNAVIGGYVYRGSKIPALEGTYVFGDAGSAIVRALQAKNGVLLNGPAPVNVTGPVLKDIGSFGEDQTGELYLCDHVAGIVYRLEPK
jgi:glucose/arabinose dehydrogenase